MLCNISYYPEPSSSKVIVPPLRIKDILSALSNRFFSVELVTDYALRFIQGNIQGVIFDSGYAEIIAPEKDVKIFSECAKIVIDLIYQGSVRLRGFDAFIDDRPGSSANIDLYRGMAQFLDMKWRVSHIEGFRPLFSARFEKMEKKIE